MLSREVVKEKLLECGYKTQPDIAIEIVTGLTTEGVTMRSLHEDKVNKLGHVTPALASNKTIYKFAEDIKPGGKLRWLVDEAEQQNVLLGKLSEIGDLDAEINIGTHQGVDGVSVEIIEGWQRFRDDGLGRWRRRTARDHEAQLQDFDWTVSNLESIRIPPSQVPAFLLEFQKLEMDRYSNGARRNGQSFLKGFKGFEKYLSMMATVILLRRYVDEKDRDKRPPYEYASAAGQLYARGLIDDDIALIDAGEDIIRYEIWRSRDGRDDTYIKHYELSQEKYIRPPAHHAFFLQVLGDFIKGETHE